MAITAKVSSSSSSKSVGTQTAQKASESFTLNIV